MKYFIIKKCNKNLGCFALFDIPKNTLILHEKVFTINENISENKNINDYIFTPFEI